jgi:hypothetical protein
MHKSGARISDIDDDDVEVDLDFQPPSSSRKDDVDSGDESHGALSSYRRVNPANFGSLAPSQLVKVIGQKAYDKHIASFTPIGVKATRINLSANPEFIEKAAYVHAALDGIRFMRRTPNVFTANGITDFCNTNIRTLLGEPIDEEEAELRGIPEQNLFHIDKWFVEKRGRGDLGYDPCDAETDLRKLQKEDELAINWISILIETELKWPGFVKLLCSALEMEDRILNQIELRRARVMSFCGSGAGATRPTPHGY